MPEQKKPDEAPKASPSPAPATAPAEKQGDTQKSASDRVVGIGTSLPGQGRSLDSVLDPGPDDTLTNVPEPLGPGGKLVNPTQEQIGAVGRLDREATKTQPATPTEPSSKVLKALDAEREKNAEKFAA